MTAISKPARFQATIYKIWLMRHVDVPEEIGRALEKESGKKKHIPVVATMNGRSTRTTLVPAGGGRYRLQIITALRKAAGDADAGDMIGVALKFDDEPREISVPPELSAVLKDHPKARKEFEGVRAIAAGTSPAAPALLFARQIASSAGEHHSEVHRSSPNPHPAWIIC